MHGVVGLTARSKCSGHNCAGAAAFKRTDCGVPFREREAAETDGKMASARTRTSGFGAGSVATSLARIAGRGSWVRGCPCGPGFGLGRVEVGMDAHVELAEVGPEV